MPVTLEKAGRDGDLEPRGQRLQQETVVGPEETGLDQHPVAHAVGVELGQLLTVGLAWLAWRYLDGAPEMPWVLGGIALVGGLFAVCAPARWLRALLRWNLFSQDLFRR